MELSHIDVRMYQQAVDLHLACAYPTGEIPSHVRVRAKLDDSVPLAHLLESDLFEKPHRPSHPQPIIKYQIRLGNQVYPHMKIGLERCSLTDDLIFMVDTHDHHFIINNDLPGAEEFRQIQCYNQGLKRDVEERWETAGLPTFFAYLREGVAAIQTEEGADRTIAVLDDDQALQEMECAILESAGYRVIGLSDPHHGLEQMEDHVDLVLLDVMMPETDGFRTLKHLRHDRHLECPVLFVSSIPGDFHELRLADGFVSKPFAPQHLLREIRNHLP